MNYYELSFLISSKEKEGSIKEIVEKINQFLNKEGVIFFQSLPMKRSLAYPIKKEEEAFLTTFEFEMESNKIEELEKLLKSAKGILRYLIIRKKKPQQKPTTPPEEKSKKKVKISQLDEKLKEILGENESK